jgi:hypothetical protein
MNEERRQGLLDYIKKHKMRKLRRMLHDGKNCYCIQGAMCEYYREVTGLGSWIRGIAKNEYYFLLGEQPNRAYMPEAVSDWFGLPALGGYIIKDGYKESLWYINDNFDLSLSAMIRRIK